MRNSGSGCQVRQSMSVSQPDPSAARYWWARHRLVLFGLAAALLAAVITVPAYAAERARPSAVVAARYGGSDLSGGQPAWLPRRPPTADILQPLPYVNGTIVPNPSAATAPIPVAQGRDAQSAQAPRRDQPDLAEILSEVRTGVLAHDAGLVTVNQESGVDFSLDAYFVSPGLLDPIGSPRPFLGVAANSAGGTSQIYGGLAWDWTFWDPFFVAGTLGLAIHDGKLDNRTPDRKALGCRVLFRESISLGARFLERQSISLQFAHISNANLCTHNAGLDTIGIQYGYRF